MRIYLQKDCMYHPIQPGISKADKETVSYTELLADKKHRDTVVCSWLLKSTQKLDNDFEYLVVPDACVDIIFDLKQKDFDGCILMSPGIKAEKLSLGTSFSYFGIRFLFGAWQYQLESIIDASLRLLDIPGVELAKFHSKIQSLPILKSTALTTDFIDELCLSKCIQKNERALRLIQATGNITNVADMAKIYGVGERQLRRVLPNDTGYAPHDLLKILRFQYALKNKSLEHYADQAHFIRSFKDVIDITPGEFKRLF